MRQEVRGNDILNKLQVDANMGYWQGVRSDIFDKTYWSEEK